MRLAVRLPALVSIFMLAAQLLVFTLKAQAKDLTPPGLADGPGIWVNMWHFPEGNLDYYCTQLKSYGIRNLFVQTSRSNTDAICNREKLGSLLEACHRQGIRVIAWSFAELTDPKADAEKLIAAAKFESSSGERLDCIAGNLEKNLSASRVESYAQHLRNMLGPLYPMMAVVYSPLNRAPQVAITPWKTLAQYFDVLAPMAYWGGRHQKLSAYSYTQATIQKIRQLADSSKVEIHVIGDGMGTDPSEITQFLKACKTAEATSASLYPNHTPTLEQLAALSRYCDYLPINARFRLAAFREIVKSGLLDEPPANDPCQPISRGNFYRLVIGHLQNGQPLGCQAVSKIAQSHCPSKLSATEAYKILQASGFIANQDENQPSESIFDEPITHKEALTLIAQIVERKVGRLAPTKKQSARADHWLVPPADAEPIQPIAQKISLLNYLDAAQIVLEARAGVK